LRLAVLMIEDSFFSADLNVREVKKAGVEVDYRMVSSKKSMAVALKEQKWDIIICNTSMPNFTALMALKVRNKINRNIPFIIVSEDDEEVIYKKKEKEYNAFLPKDRLQELGVLVCSLII